MAAAGCDKRVDRAEADVPVTNLAGKPRALFFLFGDRSEPRALPIATLVDGHVVPLQLDDSGWRGFDRLYFPAGTSLSVYQDGRQVKDAVVQRGMWISGESPLYKLPRCRALRPLAAVAVDPATTSALMLELLATSDPLPALAQRTAVVAGDVDSARALAARSAQREGLTAATRGHLDLVVSAMATGATRHPTLSASYIEKGSGSGSGGAPRRHLFVLGDWSDAGGVYQTSLIHVPGDSLPEYRRLIDHVDLTGDGVDEVILEGWRDGGDSQLIFLRYDKGHWRELARSATSWCADKKS